MRRWWPPIVVAVIATLVAFFAVEPVTTQSPDFNLPIDRHKYIYMAENGVNSLGIPPFCYRIVAPFLAAQHPGSTEFGFVCVALFGIALGGLSAFLLGETATKNRHGGWIAMALYFGCRHLVFTNLADFWLTDSLAHGMILASVALALRRQLFLAILLAALAGAGRETALLIGPFVFAWGLGSMGWKRSLTVSVSVLAASLIGIAVSRTTIQNRAEDPSHLATLPAILFHRPDHQVSNRPVSVTIREVATWRIETFRAGQLLEYTILPLGAVGFALAWLSPASRRAILASVPALGVAYGQLLVGTDTERLIAYGAPAFVIAGSVALMSRVPDRKLLLFALWVWLPFAGLVGLGLLGRGGASVLVWQIACAIAVVVAVLAQKRDDGGSLPQHP